MSKIKVAANSGIAGKKNSDKKLSIYERRVERERNYLSTISRVYLIVILALFPLFTGPNGYSNIISNKATFFWTITAVFYFIFGVFLFTHIAGLEKIDRKLKFWQGFTWVDWAVVALLIITTISCILSPYQSIVWKGYKHRFDGWFSYSMMYLNFFIISRFYKPKKSDFLWFAAGSAVVCIIAFMQFHGNDFLNLFPYNTPPYVTDLGAPLYSGYSISYRSTLGNIDFVGSYVSIAVMVFGLLFVKTKGYLKLAFLAASAMNFALLIIGGAELGKVAILGAITLVFPILMSSRRDLGYSFVLISSWGCTYFLHHLVFSRIMSGWTRETVPAYDYYFKQGYDPLPLKYIAALSAAALLIGLLLILLKKIKWPSAKIIVTTGVALVLVFGCAGIAAVEIIGGQQSSGVIHEARETLHGNFGDSFGSNRGFVWRTAIETSINSFKLFGTGSDTFLFALGDRVQNTSMEQIGVLFDKAHNDYLQILVCNGILALLSYLAFIAGMIYFSLKKVLSSELVLVALGGFIAYVIQGVFGIDSITVTPIFWALAALLRSNQLAFSQES